MLGERTATALGIRPYVVHGVRHVEVSLRFDDGRVETVRLGGESVPADLREGEPVIARMVMSTVVEIRRPA